MLPEPAILGGKPCFDEPCQFVRPRLPDIADMVKGLQELEASRRLSNQGRYAAELESRIAEQCDVRHCALFCNGTTAIMALARALDLEGEVLVPSFTFAASVQALAWQGLRPRFVDIDPHTLLMDPAHAEASITPGTSGIFPVNLFGRCVDPAPFEALAERHGLALFFDSAQAFGASVGGRPVGGSGRAEVLSFHATKPFHTGEGGAVVTDDAELHERLGRIRNFGFDGYLDCTELGLNGKLDELSALMGLHLLGPMPGHRASGQKASRAYASRLDAIPGLWQPAVPPGVELSDGYFPIRIDPERFGLDSLELNYALMAERIVTRCYFYPPVHRTTYWAAQPAGRDAQLPVTDAAALSTLCLPLHADLDDRDARRVADAIARCHAHAPEIRAAVADHVPRPWRANSALSHGDAWDLPRTERNLA